MTACITGWAAARPYKVVGNGELIAALQTKGMCKTALVREDIGKVINQSSGEQSEQYKKDIDDQWGHRLIIPF